MRIHGAAALFGIAVFGSLWASHLRPAWQHGRHRASGASLAVAWLLLLLTGYGLYYVPDEDWRAPLSLVHQLAGFGLPLGLGLHVLTVRRSRRVARMTAAARP